MDRKKISKGGRLSLPEARAAGALSDVAAWAERGGEGGQVGIANGVDWSLSNGNLEKK